MYFFYFFLEKDHEAVLCFYNVNRFWDDQISGKIPTELTGSISSNQEVRSSSLWLEWWLNVLVLVRKTSNRLVNRNFREQSIKAFLPPRCVGGRPVNLLPERWALIGWRVQSRCGRAPVGFWFRSRSRSGPAPVRLRLRLRSGSGSGPAPVRFWSRSGPAQVGFWLLVCRG